MAHRITIPPRSPKWHGIPDPRPELYEEWEQLVRKNSNTHTSIAMALLSNPEMTDEQKENLMKLGSMTDQQKADFERGLIAAEKNPSSYLVWGRKHPPQA